MSAFSAIELDKLPAPQIIEPLDFETILAALKADLVERAPKLAAVLELESESITKLLEICAYRELHLRAQINDAGKQVMMAWATNGNLAHLAALFGVEAEEDEDVERLRLRSHLAPEGYSVAGPEGAYVFWGLSASPEVKDISVDAPIFARADIDPALMAQLPEGSIVLEVTYDAGLPEPMPGQVAVTILASEGQGAPGAQLIETVSTALNAEEVRPLTDVPVIRGAEITSYRVEAELTLYGGPDDEVVRQAALAALKAYTDKHHRLGHDITLSGLYAALHQQGVQNVTLTEPATDIVIGPSEAAYCTNISVTVGGRDV